MKSTKISICILAILASAHTFAQTNVLKTKAPKQTALGSEYQYNVGLQYNQLMEDVGDVVGNQYQADIGFEYNSDPDQDIIKHFKTSGRINSEDQLLFSVENASLEFKLNNSEPTTTKGTAKSVTAAKNVEPEAVSIQSISVGRMPLDWAKTDELWGLGFVNNRRNFDFFEPGKEGLAGVLYKNRKERGVQYDTFASFLYVPEMNPSASIDEESKTITCENPWCTEPASSTEIANETYAIQYDVDQPEIMDVVLRYSIGTKVGYKWDGLEISAYAIRKPENQISKTAEVSVNATTKVISANITPRFYYQDILGGRIDYNPTDNINLNAAVINMAVSDKPDGADPLVEYTEYRVDKKDQQYVAAGGTIKFTRGLLGINYIGRTSDYDIKKDLLVEYPRWNEAVNIVASLKLGDKFLTKLDYKIDTKTQDRLTMFNVAYQASPSVAMKAGVQMIGSDQKTFWSDFENNDSVYAGLNMVF